MKLSPPRLLCMPNGGDAIASDNLRQKKLNTFFYAVFLGTLAALVVMILYFIYAMASMYNGSRAFDWLLSVFWDFVVVMDFSLSDTPYLVEGSSYPPIAMMMLYPFALICKDVYLKYDAAVMTPEAMNTGVITTPQF